MSDDNNKTTTKAEPRTRTSEYKPRSRTTTTDYRRTREGATIARERTEPTTITRDEYLTRAREHREGDKTHDEPRSYPLMAYQEEPELFVKKEVDRFDWQETTLHPRKIMFATDDVPMAWKELTVQQCRGSLKDKDKK